MSDGLRQGLKLALKAEIISVGTELLLGEIDDTDASYLSRRLAELGVDVHFRHTVGDNLRRIVQTLSSARRRADLLVLCGGLGPTPDDVTREALAELTQRPLQSSSSAELKLRQFFAARGLEPTPNNLQQCQVPRGGELLDNAAGTAPGVWLEHESTVFVALPGPPVELQTVFEQQVFPRLRQRLQAEGALTLYTRSLRTSGVGESVLAEQIGDLLAGQRDPTLGVYASPGEVRIRLATKAAGSAEAERTFGPVEQELRRRLGAHVYGVDDESLETAVGNALLAAGATLAVAESCTGGLIASRITDVPGASRYFLAGYVTYSDQAKRDLLGVPEALLAEHGAVSAECAEAMAHGAWQRSGATYGLSVTGIAGPGGGTPDKPVGLVYLGVSHQPGAVVQRFLWPGTREQFKRRTSQLALDLLRRFIIEA